MKLTTVCVLISIVCLFAFSVKSATASEWSTRTCQFMWSVNTPPYSRYHINLTSPMYATPRSGIQLELLYFFETDVTIEVPGHCLQVSALLSNGTWQRLYNRFVLWNGTYSNGTSQSILAYVVVPSDAKLGSLLNVSVCSDYCRWMPYPTEVRNMDYDDLELAYINAQSQVNTLNQQVDFLNQHISNLDQQMSNLYQQVEMLTSEKDTLNQQVNTLNQQLATLNSQVADWSSQVSNLKAQLAFGTLVVPSVTLSVAIVAIVVAVYMFYSKRKIARVANQS